MPGTARRVGDDLQRRDVHRQRRFSSVGIPPRSFRRHGHVNVRRGPHDCGFELDGRADGKRSAVFVRGILWSDIPRRSDDIVRSPTGGLYCRRVRNQRTRVNFTHKSFTPQMTTCISNHHSYFHSLTQGQANFVPCRMLWFIRRVVCGVPVDAHRA